MKLHLKLTSVTLSAVMCASMVMAPVSVIADESVVPEQTQSTEATEKEAPKATEKPAPKETEKPAPEEPEKKETEPSVKEEPSETKEQQPSETEKNVPSETTEQKPSETEEHKSSETEKAEPETSETEAPAQTEETTPSETVPEETERKAEPEKGPAVTARRKAANEVSFTKTQNNTCFGTSKIAAPAAPETDKAWSGSYVYFGKYDSKPIRFRVLAPKTTAYGGTTMFLDCDEMLFQKRFDDDSNVWANSEIKSFLNGDFLKNFTSAEMNAIAASTRSAHALETGTTAGKVSSWTKSAFANCVALKGERVFLLDVEEASNIDYGYSVTNGDAVNRKKTILQPLWWLRSASNDNSRLAGYVGSHGQLYHYRVDYVTGVAPALNINQSSIIFSSKISGNFNAVGAEYKLTLKDKNLTIAVPAGQQAKISGTTVTVPYTIGGTNKGTANRVSYLITNKAGTEIKYYNAMSGGTSGTGAFELPSDLSLDGWGTDYDVYILAEQANGSQTTDNASTPAKVASPFDNTLTVTAKTAKVKYKKLRKKKQTVARSKVMDVRYAQGKVTYKLTGVKRGKSKKYKKYFKINAATGKVTIKKRLKKGTYKVTCRVTAAGDASHRCGIRTVTFTIKVK